MPLPKKILSLLWPNFSHLTWYFRLVIKHLPIQPRAYLGYIYVFWHLRNVLPLNYVLRRRPNLQIYLEATVKVQFSLESNVNQD